jgi:hypothetical protein
MMKSPSYIWVDIIIEEPETFIQAKVGGQWRAKLMVMFEEILTWKR